MRFTYEIVVVAVVAAACGYADTPTATPCVDDALQPMDDYASWDSLYAPDGLTESSDALGYCGAAWSVVPPLASSAAIRRATTVQNLVAWGIYDVTAAGWSNSPSLWPHLWARTGSWNATQVAQEDAIALTLTSSGDAQWHVGSLAIAADVDGKLTLAFGVVPISPGAHAAMIDSVTLAFSGAVATPAGTPPPTPTPENTPGPSPTPTSTPTNTLPPLVINEISYRPNAEEFVEVASLNGPGDIIDLALAGARVLLVGATGEVYADILLGGVMTNGFYTLGDAGVAGCDQLLSGMAAADHIRDDGNGGVLLVCGSHDAVLDGVVYGLSGGGNPDPRFSFGGSPFADPGSGMSLSRQVHVDGVPWNNGDNAADFVLQQQTAGAINIAPPLPYAHVYHWSLFE